MLSNAQKQFIAEVALREGFEHYDVNLDQESMKGGGYMSIITLVQIKEKSTGKVLHLILKSAHQREELRELMSTRSAFERENHMYGVIFKEFSDLQKANGVKQLFDFTAKYFGGLNKTNDECLALENLKEKGFILWDKKKPMDSHHVEAVVKEYTKFHAMSYAMRKLRPEKYAEITEKINFNIFEKKLSDEYLRDSTISNVKRGFRAVEGNLEATAGLKKFLELSAVFFKQVFQERNKYTVIMHGDCWCNNMMFKYEDTISQIPSKVYLLDWQLSSMGSPMQDLAYFFYVNSSKECMDNYNTYLKIYHDNLSEMLSQFGINIQEMMTFEELQIQWRIYAKFGMYMALVINKAMLSEGENVSSLEDLTGGPNQILDIFNVDISDNNEYNERISIVINHMVQNSFI